MKMINIIFLLLLTIINNSCIGKEADKKAEGNYENSIIKYHISKDSSMLPLFIHKRYSGQIGNRQAFIDFTIKSDGNSEYFISAYPTFDSMGHFSRLDLSTSQREKKYNNSSDIFDMSSKAESENVSFNVEGETIDMDFNYQLHGFFDKQKGIYKGYLHLQTGEDFPFEFKQNVNESTNTNVIIKFEKAIKDNGFPNVAKADIFQYTYFDKDLISGIFAYKDTTPQLKKNSMGCSNYTYSYNIKNNSILKIDKIFKSNYRKILLPYIEDNYSPEFGEDKFRDGHFFVAKGGIVFVKIQNTDCYFKQYQGRQYFLPFKLIKELNIIDENYCKSMGIDLN